jgi:antitoxin (DNA-binding transcriptional repressor) of toxin-antitoxin stability system
MKEVSVTELRQNLQAFLAKANGGQRVRVTAHGRVIAELAPPTPELDRANRARQRLRGSMLKFKKPTAPAFDAAEWEMSR